MSPPWASVKEGENAHRIFCTRNNNNNNSVLMSFQPTPTTITGKPEGTSCSNNKKRLSLSLEKEQHNSWRLVVPRRLNTEEELRGMFPGASSGDAAGSTTSRSPAGSPAPS